MIELGQIPQELPLPPSRGIVGRLYLKLRKYHCIVDVFPFYADGELVWCSYRWTNSAWRKIPMFTRADERCFPKTLAQKAHDFLCLCKDNQS